MKVKISSALALLSIVMIGGCHQEVVDDTGTSVGLRDGRYPERWWEAVPRAGAPKWEIFPDEAGKGEVILSKRNELGLLSNFAATPFEYHGKKYGSVEGFWQMMKFPEGPEDERAYAKGVIWNYGREQVGKLTSFDANHAGKEGEDNMRVMGITWVTFEGRKMEYRAKVPGEHYQLIVEAMREKVRQNPEVQRVLLGTGDLILRPDHRQGPDDPPEWRYYDIMMQIRSDLRAQQIVPATQSDTRPAE